MPDPLHTPTLQTGISHSTCSLYWPPRLSGTRTVCWSAEMGLVMETQALEETKAGQCWLWPRQGGTGWYKERPKMQNGSIPQFSANTSPPVTAYKAGESGNFLLINPYIRRQLNSFSDIKMTRSRTRKNQNDWSMNPDPPPKACSTCQLWTWN